MLSGFHLRVSRLVLRAVEPFGFALDGGYALQAHGIVDRPSKDIDAYTALMDDQVFERAGTATRRALEDAGFTVLAGQADSWFRSFVVAAPGDGAVVVDLGYDYREHTPVAIADIGQVLALEDVVLEKVRALWDRAAPRDYLDIDAILDLGRWTVQDLSAMLTKIRPEATAAAFADVLMQASTVDAAEFADYGLPAAGTARMAERLRAAAASM